MRYQLLALDVDGTTLDPQGELRPTVRDAIQAAQAQGLRVVMCTGRRFRTAQPVAQQLGLTTPLIVHNGALIKDPISGDTLYHQYLPDQVYRQSLTLLSQVSTPLVYIDAFHDNIDILTSSWEAAHPFQQAYLQATVAHCRIGANLETPPLHGVVMMSIMAEASRLHALRGHVEVTLDSHAQVTVLTNHNYSGHILEIISPNASKWQALQHLIAQENIDSEQVIAVGDDWNDLDMIRHAGLGIAMGSAPDELKAVANYVTGSNAEDGLAQAIDQFVLCT